MSHKNDSPSARALRRAGFVPLPRLWVKGEDMPVIREIAERYSDEVNEVRHSWKGTSYVRPEPKPEPEPIGDPVEDKEAAWAMFEQQRNTR